MCGDCSQGVNSIKNDWTEYLTELHVITVVLLFFCSCEHQKSQAVQKLNKEKLLAYLEVHKMLLYKTIGADDFP